MNIAEWQKRVLDGIRRGGAADGLFAEPGRGASALSRFDVYAQGYWLRVSESLDEDFPLTQRLIGAARFEREIRDFLAAKTSAELELGEVSLGFAEFLAAGAGAAVERAVRLDLLALEAQRAPEPEGQGGFGLHPSTRFYSDGQRGYVLWRFDGEVRRERIDARTARLLGVFREPADLETLSARLGALDEGPAFVQAAVAEWTGMGVICQISPSHRVN